MDTSQKSSKKLKQPSQVRSKGNGAQSDVAPKSSQDADKGAEPSAAPAGQRSEWIAEVSHELRLPIANIKLLVETLLDGALDEPIVAKRMLLRAKVEVDRLQSLVVNLAFDRICLQQSRCLLRMGGICAQSEGGGGNSE